jgi:hypothetical protein
MDVSIQATERYLGCKHAVNDRLVIGARCTSRQTTRGKVMRNAVGAFWRLLGRA